MKFTGERIVFNDVPNIKVALNLQRHIERYAFALPYCFGRSVIDAACGTGYGSMILSWVASHVHMVDISEESLDESEQLTFKADVIKEVADLNVTRLPSADVCVSFETIEHLENPEFFLENLNVDMLVSSVPINSPSNFHKRVFDSVYDAEELYHKTGWSIERKTLQNQKYFITVCKR